MHASCASFARRTAHDEPKGAQPSVMARKVTSVLRMQERHWYADEGFDGLSVRALGLSPCRLTWMMEAASILALSSLLIIASLLPISCSTSSESSTSWSCSWNIADMTLLPLFLTGGVGSDGSMADCAVSLSSDLSCVWRWIASTVL